MTPRAETAENRLPLTRERIIETALEVIDENGLQALSMRRLGADLGVEAMSLYNHIPGKEALLQAVTDYLITQTRTPRTSSPASTSCTRTTRSAASTRDSSTRSR